MSGTRGLYGNECRGAIRTAWTASRLEPRLARDCPRWPSGALVQYIMVMRMIPSLLRVLLVTSLVLNGLGLPMPAHALEMPHSQASMEPPATQAPAPDKSSEPLPCHGEGAALVGSVVLSVSAEPAPPDAQADPGSIDCCDSGSCDGVCMQSTCAVLAAGVADAEALPMAPAARSIPAGTPTPALPHPIRPPIG